MAIFQWICRDCNIWWDRDCAVGKAPMRTKCPKCKHLSDRYYEKQNLGVSFKDDGTGNQEGNRGAMDFHSVRRRYKKFHEKGYDKKSGDRWLNQSIETTKKAMDDENFRYKSANINWEKFADSRGLKKVSHEEAKQKVERSRKLTADAYDRANKMGYKDIGSEKLDIAKPNKNKPT